MTEKEARERIISEGTFADLIALTEEGHIPTELELDRFIRGCGYRLPPKLELVGDVGDEITYAVDKGRTGEIRTNKLTRRDMRIASFQLAADRKAIEGVKDD